MKVPSMDSRRRVVRVRCENFLTTDDRRLRFHAFFNFRLIQIRMIAPMIATMISEIRPPDE